ncbi:MAG: FAD-dependent oxidoreductase [Gemmatimonadales bacterium]
MTGRYDAIIIGSGIIGAAIAFELSKKGYRTVNVDKLAAAGEGSTGATCAIVRTHYSTWDGTALAYESFRHWQDWPAYLEVEDERGPARLIETGMVIILSAQRNFEKELRFHDQLGIPYQRWDVATLQAKLPSCDTTAFYPPKRADDERFGDQTAESVPGAIFIPSAGYVNDPQLASHNLQRAAEAKGAKFLFHTEVVDIRRHDGQVAGVTLKSGDTIAAPVVVNAAGPHSFIVNRMARIDGTMKVTTRALRHEVHYLPAPDAEELPFISDDDIGGYCRPEVGHTMLIGSQDPACDPQEWIDDPDDFNRDVTSPQWQSQVYRMALRIPGLDIPTHPKGIADLYDVSDDWIPIYDRSDLAGFYLAIGTSGNQFKNAPMVGRLMAELIAACEAGHDHDGDAVQVRCPYTGESLDLGFYSRNREVNRASSFSVLG